MQFSSASLSERLAGVLSEPLTLLHDADPASGIVVGTASLGGIPVWVAGSDATHARGAIGVKEAEALCALFRSARQEPRPLVLLLDSSGAKVDETLAALGAFRRLFAEALRTRLAGIPMLALLGRGCFGGASMLACLCNWRIYSPRTLLAVSGPAVIQALSGENEPAQHNAGEIYALMGGDVRCTLGDAEILEDDDLASFAARARLLLSGSLAASMAPDIARSHRLLGHRIRAARSALEHPAPESCVERFRGLLPPGYEVQVRGPVLKGLGSSVGKPVFVGIVGGAAVGAEVCWLIADELIKLLEGPAPGAVILVLDASGHAATSRDESFMLSAYLTHLALVIASLPQAGIARSLLWIIGQAAGAVYVAFAAPVQTVSAVSNARIRILPEAAVQQILGAEIVHSDTAGDWMESGVADALLDARLAVVH